MNEITEVKKDEYGHISWATPTPSYITYDELCEINSMPQGWVKIREIAKEFGISQKPKKGWSEAIWPILNAQKNLCDTRMRLIMELTKDAI